MVLQANEFWELLLNTNTKMREYQMRKTQMSAKFTSLTTILSGGMTLVRAENEAFVSQNNSPLGIINA